MDRFSICQAYQQLESDYNVGGWLRERPSNQRRRESIGCQLSRMGFSNPYGWVDICHPEEEFGEDHETREVYLRAVLRLDLPIDEEMMAFMKGYFTKEYMAKFPQTAGLDYKQGK